MFVSIITPTYNRANLLYRAAQSVFKQSYEKIEYIIVDDGSTDNTTDVVKKFNKDYIKYIKLSENQGVSAARNKGVEAANGEAILFLDSDDELRDNAISLLVNGMSGESNSCACVFGYKQEIEPNGKSHTVIYPSKIEYGDLASENCAGGFSGKLLRRSVFEDIGTIDQNFPAAEDFDFYLRLVRNGYYIKCIDNVIFNRYHNNNQLSSNVNIQIFAQKKLFDKHKDILTARHRAQRTYRLGHLAARENMMKKAIWYFIQSIYHYPFRVIYYYYALSCIFGYKSYQFSMRGKDNVKESLTTCHE